MVRFSSLGDVLLAAPAVRAIKRRFPHSRVDLLVASGYADAARLIPDADQILSFDRSTGLPGLLRLRGQLSGRYSVLVDLQNNFRSAFLRATTFPTVWVKARRYRFRRWVLIRFKRNLYHELRPVPIRYLDALELIGGHDDGAGLELRVPSETQEWARDYLSSRCDLKNPVVALCPGARHNTKRWPTDRWIALGSELVIAGKTVLIIGSQSELDLIREVSSQIPGSVPVSDRSVVEVAALFMQAATVVSSDSGLMHLAGGVGTPVVAIFGPTVEEFGFYPFRSRNIVLAHDLYCRPCTAIGGEQCPERHFRCMLETTPATVLNAVTRMLFPEQTLAP